MLPSRFAIVPPPAQPLNVSRLRSRPRPLTRRPAPRLPRRWGSERRRPVDGARDRSTRRAAARRCHLRTRRRSFLPIAGGSGSSRPRSSRRCRSPGGPAITLGPVTGASLGASWGDDNTIVFATNDPSTGLWRVSADGGEPTVLTTPDAAQRESDHAFPSVLPGGRGVLFTITAAGQADNAQVAVLDLKTGQRKTLVRGGSQAEYVDPVGRHGTGRVSDLRGGRHAARRPVRSRPARSARRSGDGCRARDDQAERRSQLRRVAAGHALLRAGWRGRADDAAVARVGRPEGARGTDQGAAARLRCPAPIARRYASGGRHLSIRRTTTSGSGISRGRR